MPEVRVRARKVMQAMGRHAMRSGDTQALLAAEQARQQVLSESVSMPDPGAALTELMQRVLLLVHEAIN